MDVSETTTLSIQDLKSRHAENQKTWCPSRQERKGFFFKKERIKFAKRKWQWKMYSPSGSKRFQLKRNRAYGGGGGLLLVCRRVCTAALRPSLRSVTPPVSESRDHDWSFLNRSEIFFIYLFAHLSPRQRHIGASVAGIELG